jgi:hypothetical protein
VVGSICGRSNGQNITIKTNDRFYSRPATYPTPLLLFHSSELFLVSWIDKPSWPKASSLSRFLDHTQTQHTPWFSSGQGTSRTQGSVPGNARHSQDRDRHPCLQLAIQVSERPHTHDLDRTATGIGVQTIYYPLFARGQCGVLVPIFRERRISVLKYVLNPTSGCYTQALAQEKLT